MIFDIPVILSSACASVDTEISMELRFIGPKSHKVITYFSCSMLNMCVCVCEKQLILLKNNKPY